MASVSSNRVRSAWWWRFIGATGLLIVLLGAIPAATTLDATDPSAWRSAWARFFAEAPGFRFSSRLQAAGLALMLLGGIAFGLSLVVRILHGLRTVAGRRNAAATNALVQIALVIALLIGVNAYSFRHYVRRDWTRDRQFSLPPTVAAELARLRGPTTIVVYQRHKTFGRLSEKPDATDYAAERKVVEKVQDLVDLFREFGPQFRVEVLDIESDGYEEKLDALTREAPALRAAIAGAPENSIFFHSQASICARPDGKPELREHVQRLSFNDFYQLDKTASLGKSVIVLFQKRVPKPGDETIAGLETKIRRLADPDAADGPDIRLMALRADDPDFPRLRDLAVADAEPLRPILDEIASNKAADNAVIVVKDGRAAQWTFAAFAALTDAEARTALRPRGNLVLLPQGVESFAAKVLAVEERRPRVAFAVIHEWLTTDGLDEFTLAGVKSALTTHGFDVVDIVLKKKWGEAPEPESAAYTLDESKYERLIDELAEVEAGLDQMTTLVRQLKSGLEYFRTASLEDLTRRYRSQLGGRPFTEELRQRQIAAISADLQTLEYVIKQNSEARRQYEDEKSALASQERVVESRRMTDVRAKLSRLLADCDLLVIPRMTLRDVVSGYAIPSRFYRLDEIQTAAIREFLTAGKPILACFGPTNEPPDRRLTAMPGPDSVEDLLAQFGIRFGRQTILFGADSKALAERRSNPLATGSNVRTPPVKFDAPPATPWLSAGDLFALGGTAQSHPIAAAMEITRRNVGAKRKLELDARHPRPVYFVPVRPDDLVRPRSVRAEFLFTDPDAWNEDQPFPTQQRTPRFEPPKPDDPSRGTREERRRGAFPIGIALETTVPLEWAQPQAAAAKWAGVIASGAEPVNPAGPIVTHSLVPADEFAAPGSRPTPIRIAAIGQGGWFVGPELSPARESLLVTICNWLLRRDERLPAAAGEPWRYPRVELSDRGRSLWSLAMMAAVPGLCVYVGRLVLLQRRYR